MAEWVAGVRASNLILDAICAGLLHLTPHRWRRQDLRWKLEAR
ncbi:MAG: hypothetical protein AAGF78_06500 [Pseudomonadota bacterium]